MGDSIVNGGSTRNSAQDNAQNSAQGYCIWVDVLSPIHGLFRDQSGGVASYFDCCI
ncbi:MAG: hypothetical protein AAFR58_09405 [Cyanobacteria bacterium J06627_28]